MAESKFARPSRVTVPEHAHPLTKIIFSEMNRQGITYSELEWRSGVLLSTVKAWRQRNRPGIETIESCLGALGWDLIATPRPEHLPTELVAELDALAGKWGEQLTSLRPMFIAAAARTHETMPLTHDGMSQRPDHQSALAA